MRHEGARLDLRHQQRRFLRQQQFHCRGLFGQLESLHERDSLRSGVVHPCRGPRGRGDQPSPALLDIDRLGHTRQLLFAQVVLVAGPFVVPGFDVETVPAGARRSELGAPAIVAERDHGHRLFLERAGATPDQPRRYLVVTVHIDVGLDHDTLADYALGRKRAAIHAGGYPLDPDPGCFHG